MTAPETAVRDEGPSAPSLESHVSDLLGGLDYSSSVTPEPDESSAEGTTPSEPDAGTEPGTEDAAADQTQAAASDGTTPATPTETEPEDPFADTTPATFKVNGRDVTNEDIRVFKEGGAVIRPDALPAVLNKLSERESLFERNRAQSVEYQTLAKAVEWTDPESKKTYAGPEAAVEMRIGNAKLLAENTLLVQTLTDPARLASILTVEKGPDGLERITVSRQALANLQTQNELQQMKSEQLLRSHFQTVLAQAAQSAPQPIDYTAATTSLITDLAAAEKLDASVLTAQDKALLAKQLPFHTKDGQVSLEWQELVKDRIADRTAQKQNAVKLASTTADATKKGLANMAAAARGVKPAAKPVTPTAPPKPPVNPKVQAESDSWDIMERAASSAMRAGR